MNCPTCQATIPEAATACPSCHRDLSKMAAAESAPESADSSPARWIALTGLALVVLAIGAAAFAVNGNQSAVARYADRFPSGAVAYLEVDIAALTSIEFQEVIESFSPVVEWKTGQAFDPHTLIDEKIASFDEELAAIGVSFSDDIAPWASGTVAVAAFHGPDEPGERNIVLVGGDDPPALDALLGEVATHADDIRTIGGTEFLVFDDDEETRSALVGRIGMDLLLVSDVALAEAMMAQDGERLGDVDGFTRHVQALPAGGVLVFAVDGDAAETEIDHTSRFGGWDSGLSGLTEGWMAGTVALNGGNLRLDHVGKLADELSVSGPDPALLAAIPDETFAYFRVGMALEHFRATMPMLGAFEGILEAFSKDAAMALWPSTGPEILANVALIGIASEDQSAAVDQLEGLAEGFLSGMVEVGARESLTFLTTDPDLIASDPEASFAEGDLYRKASDLVDGDLQAVVDVPALTGFIGRLAADDDPAAAEALDCLPYGVAAAGAEVDGQTIRSSMVVEISPRC